ncbi:olfactory receptor 2T2-like [Anabas testudineus]|uniref:olfactory receptor 2T2-like n=1 Tax=Anabas testudineus TaxID=64144 RepID=UPI000E45BB0F|nr:olfactory receptor 2T2-like [Anabas testudineus]
MDDTLNVTYITLGGFVELQEYRYLCFMIMFTVYILIICLNVTIICLICTHRNLHEPMYIFIAALLLNSVLYSTNIYPKLLNDLLSEKQIISYSLCFFQVFVYYTLIGSEFLLLAAMAYDRYVSICKPLQYPTIMTKTTVSVFLVLVWFVPACELAVSVAFNATIKRCSFTLKGLFCNNSFYTLQCVVSVGISMYGMIILVNVTYFPLFFVLFTYIRILLVCYRSSNTVRRKAAQTCLPHLLVLSCLSSFGMYDAFIPRVDSHIPKTVHLILTLQIMLYHPLLNPIVYGLKMKEISQHLNKLLFSNKSHLQC